MSEHAMPAPEENVECRPGKDTVCGVCGETLRWIEREFPALSGWEECRFHLAASDMYEALKAQHNAIDVLFATLIEEKKGFYPSKSGMPWAALLQGNAAIAKAKGSE